MNQSVLDTQNLRRFLCVLMETSSGAICWVGLQLGRDLRKRNLGMILVAVELVEMIWGKNVERRGLRIECWGF